MKKLAVPLFLAACLLLSGCGKAQKETPAETAARTDHAAGGANRRSRSDRCAGNADTETNG